MDFETSGGGMNYAGLLLVIFVAVAGGNLFADWAMQEWVEYRTQRLMSETTEAFNREMANMPAVDRDSSVEQGRSESVQARSESQLGKLLEVNCERWTLAHEQYGTIITRRERAKWCGDHRAYLEEGSL